MSALHIAVVEIHLLSSGVAFIPRFSVSYRWEAMVGWWTERGQSPELRVMVAMQTRPPATASRIWGRAWLVFLLRQDPDVSIPFNL